MFGLGLTELVVLLLVSGLAVIGPALTVAVVLVIVNRQKGPTRDDD